MTNELTFAKRGRELATNIALLYDDFIGWQNTYWDRGYNSGGTQEITDADLEESGVKAADLAGLTTFIDAFKLFMDSGNRGYLSNMRQDM